MPSPIETSYRVSSRIESIESDADHFNYVAQMPKLAAQIRSAFQRVASSFSSDVITTKVAENITKNSLQYAHLQVKYGKSLVNWSSLKVAASFLRFLFPNADDRKILELLSDQMSNVGGMFQTKMQSQMYEKDKESQIVFEEYRSKMAAKQSEESASQGLLSLVQAAGENVKSASRAM